jgi:hypothetical protein
LLDGQQGTGADQQMAIFKETNDINKVNAFLIEQTMRGVQFDDAVRHDKFIRFMAREAIQA